MPRALTEDGPLRMERIVMEHILVGFRREMDIAWILKVIDTVPIVYMMKMLGVVLQL